MIAFPEKLLELIESAVVRHGGDLGGWTRRDADRLQLFDGRVTLRAEVHDEESQRDGVIHIHVLTTLHEHDDQVLDACLMGMGRDNDAAVANAAVLWITCVAGPVKSFLDNRPICMTCQAGVQGGDASAGYLEGDYGLTGLRAYVGPSYARGIDDDNLPSAIDENKPWFRFAAEAAAPRRVHIAKSIISVNGRNGWQRNLEVDGHEVSHHDPEWPVGVEAPQFGYLTRFAVFAFPQNSNEIARRKELERTILHFAEHYSDFETVDQLMAEMARLGFDAEIVHEVESFSTIAFGRALFQHFGIEYPSTVIRARRDGTVETDVPLMSMPAYARACALAGQLRAMMPKERFQALCCYNAESNVILKVMNARPDQLDFSGFKLFPCVVPDRGVSENTMNRAIAAMNEMAQSGRTKSQTPTPKKPWWKIW